MSTSQTSVVPQATTPFSGDFSRNLLSSIEHAYLSTQTFIQESFPGVGLTVEKVVTIALHVLAGLGAALLLAAQSSLFAIGFLISIINCSMMKTSIERITAEWNKQNIVTQCVVIGAAIVAWPISLASTAFFVGGRLGILLQGVELQSAPECPDTQEPSSP